MTPRTAWRGCAAAGIVAFICSWSFGRIPGLVACGPTGGLQPIIAFEFARTPADIAALFGSEPCTSTLVAAQKTGLLLDGLGFIPAYTAFLILAVIAAGVGSRVKWPLIAAFAIAALSDEIEGVLLHGILGALPGSPDQIAAMSWAVHVKFALLALGTSVIATLLPKERWPARIVRVAIILGGFGALLGLVSRAPGVMMLGFTIAWVVLLLTALIASFWPRVFSTGS
jgi:hypothetical protein